MQNIHTTPYVKQYDATGNIVNFPETGYLTGPNRRARKNSKSRLKENSLVIFREGTGFKKFRTFIQKIGSKRILHYKPV